MRCFAASVENADDLSDERIQNVLTMSKVGVCTLSLQVRNLIRKYLDRFVSFKCTVVS